MQSQKHLHYDDELQPAGYEPSYCVYRLSEEYRYYNHLEDNASHISRITLTSHFNGDLILDIRPRTHLQCPYLYEKFEIITYPEMKFEPTLISLTFNLKQQTKVEIENWFSKVFQQLKQLDITQSTKELFLKQLRQYFDDFENGFPGGNVHTREGFPCQKKLNAEQKQTDDFCANALYGSVNKVWAALRKGQNANIEYGSMTLLTAVTIANWQQKRFAKIKKVLLLLLQYGANPNIKGNKIYKTTEEALIDSGLRKDISMFHFFQKLRLIKASKYAIPHVKPYSNTNTPIAEYINNSNLFLLSQKAAKTIYGISSGKCGYPIQEIKAKDGKLLHVITKEKKQLTQLEQKLMFNLFVKYYPDLDKYLKKKDLPKFFHENFMQEEKIPTYFDLIWLDNELVGFNIATVKEQQAKNRITHRIKFALSKPLLNPYQRLMTIISFQRGFVLQAQYPDVEVKTLYEAASFPSLLQTRHVTCYPSYDTPHVSDIIKDTYANDELYRQGDLYYINNDELAVFELPSKPKSFWLREVDIYIKFSKKWIILPGKSAIKVMENSAKQLAELAESIDPNLDGTTFAEIIEQQVNKKASVQSKL